MPNVFASAKMNRHRSEMVVEQLISRNQGSVLFIIGLATFLLYGAVTTYSFLAYDDGFFVTENAYVKQGLTRESFSGAGRPRWVSIIRSHGFRSCWTPRCSE